MLSEESASLGFCHQVRQVRDQDGVQARGRIITGGKPIKPPDVVTLSLAKGIRRHTEAAAMQRVERLVDSGVLVKGGRFGPTVRRLHVALMKAIGPDRCVVAFDTKKFKAWILSLPDDDGSSDLTCLSVQKAAGTMRRRAFPLRVTLTAHFIERLTQLSNGTNVPIAAIAWAAFTTCVETLDGKPSGTVYVAISDLLLIAKYDDQNEFALVTVFEESALDSDKRPLWNRLRDSTPPVEFHPDLS